VPQLEAAPGAARSQVEAGDVVDHRQVEPRRHRERPPRDLSLVTVKDDGRPQHDGVDAATRINSSVARWNRGVLRRRKDPLAGIDARTVEDPWRQRQAARHARLPRRSPLACWADPGAPAPRSP
jgi:hypothetical protein